MPSPIFATIFLVMFIGTFVTCTEARAFFVFGDSLVDNGNNNYLLTSARADSPPYGIDYPTHRPTGRFSNGFNIPDLISKIPVSFFYIIVREADLGHVQLTPRNVMSGLPQAISLSSLNERLLS